MDEWNSFFFLLKIKSKHFSCLISVWLWMLKQMKLERACCLSNIKIGLSWWLSWRRRWHPTPVLLPGKSHGWRSLVGCSPWGREESDATERLHFHFSLSCIGKWNGSLLQCSCLEPSVWSHRVGHDWSDLAAAAGGTEEHMLGRELKGNWSKTDFAGRDNRERLSMLFISFPTLNRLCSANRPA